MKNFVAGFLAIGAMLPGSRLPLFMLKCPLRPHPPEPVMSSSRPLKN